MKASQPKLARPYHCLTMSEQELYKLADKVIIRARENGLTIATAESCTGGWIGKALTDISGSSSVFMGSLVAYSNDIKENLLGVSQSLLITHGAVSEKVAFEMAKNCAQSFGTDIAVSVTGIAGPGGGSTEKPVGLVYMGISYNGETDAHEFRFENFGRESIRRDTVKEALNLCLKAINDISKDI